MTKKYTVASSTIVRKIPDRPSGSDNPALKLMKMITEKAVKSNSEVQVDGGMSEEMRDKSPKNSVSDTYASSR